MYLTNEEISETMDKVYDFFDTLEIPRKDKIKAGFMVEEVLLSYQEQFGEKTKVDVDITSRFETPRVIVRLRGYGYDPTNKEDEDPDMSGIDIMSKLLDLQGISTIYSYRGGVNKIVVEVRLPKTQNKNAGRAMIIALVAGIVLGFASKLLPENVFTLVTSLTNPIQSKLMGLVTAVTVPVIFFSLLSSICALDSISELNERGVKIILRQFAISAIIIVCSGFVCMFFFNGNAAAQVSFQSDELLGLVLSIFPTNLFAPFTEGNTLQLVVIALFAGTCIIVLEDRGLALKDGVSDLNRMFNLMMQYISYIIPVMIFFTLFKTISGSSLSQLAGTWKLVVTVYLSWLLIVVLMMGYVCLRWKKSPKWIIGKFGSSIVIAFSAMSCTSAGPKLYEIADKEVHIDKKLFNFWYPLSTAFLSTSTGVTLVCVSFFAANYNGIAISASWLIVCALLSFQLSITSPRVSGGIFASYAIILTQLGMPAEVVGLVTAANFLWGNTCCGLGMLVKCLDVLDLACREGAIKEPKVKAKV